MPIPSMLQGCILYFPIPHLHQDIIPHARRQPRDSEPSAGCISLTVPTSDPNALHLLDGQIQLPMTGSCVAHRMEVDGSAPSLQPCPIAHPPVANWLKRVFRPRAPRQELFPDGRETD